MCDLRLHTLLSAAVQGGEMLEETGGGEGVYAITGWASNPTGQPPKDVHLPDAITGVKVVNNFLTSFAFNESPKLRLFPYPG